MGTPVFYVPQVYSLDIHKFTVLTINCRSKLCLFPEASKDCFVEEDPENSIHKSVKICRCKRGFLSALNSGNKAYRQLGRPKKRTVTKVSLDWQTLSLKPKLYLFLTDGTKIQSNFACTNIHWSTVE